MKLHSPIRHLHDFDDVETDAPAFDMAAAREGFRCIADVLLLEGRHRFLRFSIATICAALDLDEYQRLSIFHDEVDLSMSTLEITRKEWYPFPSRYFSAAVSPSRPKRVVCIVCLLCHMALSAGPAPVSETVLLSILYPPRRFVNERTSVYANGINNDFLMKKVIAETCSAITFLIPKKLLPPSQEAVSDPSSQ